MKLSKNILIILLIQITEVLGFSLILPLLPFYAQTLGANPFQASLLITNFSLAQFIAAPIMGKLSDSYGRRPLLMLSQTSTAVGFLLLGLSNQLWMLFASRLIDGLIGSNGTIAQAYLSDISDSKDRSTIFGVSGIAFGFGMMIGPAIGGFLSQVSFQLPAFLAAGVSLISIILTYLILPETVTHKTKTKFKLNREMFFDSQQLLKYWRQPRIRQQLIEFFLYAGAHVIFTSNFSLFTQSKLSFSVADVGSFFSYIGLVMVILRAVVLPKLIDYFGEEKLEKLAILQAILGLLLANFVFNKLSLFIAMTFYASGAGLIRPLLMGDISRNVKSTEQGTVLGVANSLNSVAQIIGPALGGFLLTNSFTESVPLTSLSFMLVAAVYLFKEKKIIPTDNTNLDD